MSLNSLAGARRKVGRFSRRAAALASPPPQRDARPRGQAKIDLRAQDSSSRDWGGQDFTCDDEITATLEQGPGPVQRAEASRSEAEGEAAELKRRLDEERRRRREAEDRRRSAEEASRGVGDRIMGSIFGGGGGSSSSSDPPPPPPPADHSYPPQRVAVDADEGQFVDGQSLVSRSNHRGGLSDLASPDPPSYRSSMHASSSRGAVGSSGPQVRFNPTVQVQDVAEDRRSLIRANVYDDPSLADRFADDGMNLSHVEEQRIHGGRNFNGRNNGRPSKDGRGASCADVISHALVWILCRVLLLGAVGAVAYGMWILVEAHQQHVVNGGGGGGAPTTSGGEGGGGAADLGPTSGGGGGGGGDDGAPTSGGGTGTGTGGNTPASPTKQDLKAIFAGERFKAIRSSDAVKSVTNHDLLLQPTTPQFRAVVWLANDDPMELDPPPGGDDDDYSDEEAIGYFLERYALAVLWFGAHESAAGEGGGGEEQQQRADGFVPWSDETDWLTGQSVCSWAGVTCQGGGGGGKADDYSGAVVVKLDRSGNGLHGTLPSELFAALGKLEELRLHGNELEGAIPDAVGRSSKLTTLDLGSNFLDGAVPVSVADCAALSDLNLEQNALTGAIPPEISQLGQLTSLNLRNNDLTGSIPSSEALGGLKNLAELYLGQNGLVGSLPDKLPTRLRSVVLDKNDLTGTIPESYWKSSKTENLQLSNNRLTGRIADDMDMQHLTNLGLSHNVLTGNIPAALARSLKLEGVALEGNQFTGPVPEEIGKLVKLKQMYIHMNSVTGTVPQSVCKLRQRSLEVLFADCGGDSPKVECVCCTDCEGG